ncbi:MAG: CHAT domain-containing protein, partial [Planctomycetales bacterium]|nr:CHAT domain-containing protein [Planctomycetales bacterium]
SWRLDSQLVTLSACETALGPSIEGEYLLGFSQAFLLAGSRSIVASMWAVRDDSTALLMHRFYQNLVTRPPATGYTPTTAEALREAKQWLRTLDIRELDEHLQQVPPELRSRVRRRLAATETQAARPFEHPYFWAPFILIGNDGRPAAVVDTTIEE